MIAVSRSTAGHEEPVVADHLRVFEDQRPRLMGICYRILGSVADTEDVLQETWIRWDRADRSDVRTPQALLTTIATRLALDRLRKVRTQREVYPGPWLPEPLIADAGPRTDPAVAAELADSLSMALLVVLETLSPLERAAFVLREVFGRSYPEVAAALDRAEPAVRQLVHRARDRVEAGHARYQADRRTHALVVQRFLAACEDADLDALMEILAPDVVIVSDGGGTARAPRRPVYGRDKVARLLAGFAHRVPAGTSFTLETFNGRLGIVARVGDEPISAMAVSVAGGTVHSLQLLANPAKLGRFRVGAGIEIL